MEVKKNGKVEHSDNAHDDQVFSYLMALRVWYDGEDLAERYSIQKSTIKTDEEVDVESFEMDTEINGTNVDVETMSREPDDIDNAELEDQLAYVQQAAKYNLAKDFNKSQSDQDMVCLTNLLSTNKVAKDVYIKKNHLDTSEPAIGGTLGNLAGMAGTSIELPDSIFGGTDDYDDSIYDDDDPYKPMVDDNVRGNLASQWRSLGF